MNPPEWSIEIRKIKDLKPHPKNPRTISKDEVAHLKQSLEKFGLTDKPVINQDGVIIGGHQRVKVLKKMGWKEVPCLVPDRMLTDEEVEEALIRHNKNGGKWDWDMLANEFESIDLIDFGFNAEELLGSASDEEPRVKKVKSSEYEEKSGKKLKMCPSCGHEF